MGKKPWFTIKGISSCLDTSLTYFNMYDMIFFHFILVDRCILDFEIYIAI